MEVIFCQFGKSEEVNSPLSMGKSSCKFVSGSPHNWTQELWGGVSARRFKAKKMLTEPRLVAEEIRNQVTVI